MTDVVTYIASCLPGRWTLPILFILYLVVALPAFADEAPEGLALNLNLAAERVYRGESIPVTVTLRNTGLRVRNVGYPRVDMHGLPSVSLGAVEQQQGKSDDGITLYRFTGKVTPSKAGTFTVGPARIECEVMETAQGGAAFFGGMEQRKVSLASAPVTLIVAPLPVTGRPAAFSGAVGSFSLSVTTIPAMVTVGEPVTVTTSIRGTGSLADAACPVLADSNMQIFPVRAMRSTAQLTCEQVVIPSKVHRFPPVVWSYFDPETEGYHVLRANVPSQVVARSNSRAAQNTPIVAHVPATRQTEPVQNYFLALMAGLLLVPVLAVLIGRHRQSTAVKTAIEPSSDLRKMLQAAEAASVKGEVELFYNIAFEIIQNGVEKPDTLLPVKSRLSLNRSELPQINENYNNNAEIYAIASACDKVRYGRVMPDSITMAADLERLKQILSGMS